MPTTATGPDSMTAVQAPPVDKPKHPLPALTTFELSGFRRQLQDAIAFFDAKDPVPAIRADLQAALDAVIAEQESRQRLTRA
jgi:hypothetical protein